MSDVHVVKVYSPDKNLLSGLIHTGLIKSCGLVSRRRQWPSAQSSVRQLVWESNANSNKVAIKAITSRDSRYDVERRFR
jgi:hypothetical protein